MRCNFCGHFSQEKNIASRDGCFLLSPVAGRHGRKSTTSFAILLACYRIGFGPPAPNRKKIGQIQVSASRGPRKIGKTCRKIGRLTQKKGSGPFSKFPAIFTKFPRGGRNLYFLANQWAKKRSKFQFFPNFRVKNEKKKKKHTHTHTWCGGFSRFNVLSSFSSLPFLALVFHLSLCFLTF